MNCSFIESDDCPPIYRIRFRPSELITMYEEILANVPISDVYNTFCKYVTTSIEPIGWRAVWRSVPNLEPNSLSIQYDFEVEVMDVMHKSLEAVAVVLRLIHPNESELTAEQFDEKEVLLKETKIVNIPLTQLYVISDNDPDGQYRRTAMIIEQLRFFYNCLWRPWDELVSSENQEIFVETRLTPRLELAFDMKDKIIPQSTINRIKKLLNEAWDIKNKMEAIETNRGFDAFNVSIEDNSEIDYISETELVEAMRLKLRLEDIEREMKLLEDKHLRIIAASIKKTSDSVSDDDSLAKENKIHLISKSFTLKSTKEILTSLSEVINETETKLMFHNSLSHALFRTYPGDKIYIMPGVYSTSILPWIESDIEIIGFGGPKEKIVIESCDSVGDIFLNCNTDKVVFTGVTIRATSELQCLVMVHSGNVSFNDCILDGTDQTRNALIALSRAKVEIERCKIINEKEKGIVSRKGSVVINRDIEFNLNCCGESVDKTSQMEIGDI